MGSSPRSPGLSVVSDRSWMIAAFREVLAGLARRVAVAVAVCAGHDADLGKEPKRDS
jgi:hypothetical protein